MVVHQPVFAALWATVYVLMGVCWPAWRVRGAVWRSVRATLVIEWRGECAGMGPWEREEGNFLGLTLYHGHMGQVGSLVL